VASANIRAVIHQDLPISMSLSCSFNTLIAVAVACLLPITAQLTFGQSSAPNHSLRGLAQPPYPIAALNGCGSQLRQLLPAQVDSDHNLDLVAVCEESSAIFFGDGKGGFARIEDLPFTGGTALGDLDRDGDTDLVVGGTVLRGDGQGHFTVSQVLPGSGKPPGLNFSSIGRPTFGDFNSDGAIDLVSSDGFLMLGSGDGTFGYPINLGIATVVGTGDFDADGHRDLVAFDGLLEGKLSLHLGTGLGTFSEHPLPLDQSGLIIYEDLVVGDLNGDGADDFVFANYEGADSVLLGSPTREFSIGASSFFNPFFETTSLLLADFDNDANLDLAYVDNYDGKVLLGDGGGDFPSVVRFPTLLSPYADHGWGPVAGGDFDGNGFVDIATAIGDLFWIVPGTGHGFGAHILPESAGAHTVFSDLDLDGYDDAIMFGRQPTELVIALNNKDYSFSEDHLDWGSEIEGLDVADIDGDYLQDLVILDKFGVAVALGVGGGALKPPTYFPSAGMKKLRVTPLDRGQAPAVIILNPNQFCILIPKNDGTLEEPKCTTHEEAAFLETIGDFNGDGHRDLVFSDSRGYFILPGLGGGLFGPKGLVAVSRQYLTLLSADLNKDGQDDLVAVNSFSVDVYLGEPSGSLLALPSLWHSQYLNAPMIADTDGNGTQDLVIHGVTGFYGDQISFIVMSGEGDGTFAAPVRFAAPEPIEEWFLHEPSFVGGDLNGDSQIDLLFRHSNYGPGMWLFENRTPQLNHRPTALFHPLPQVECDTAAGSEVLLDASGSEDPDSAQSNGAEIILIAWYEDLGLPSVRFLGTGQTLSVNLGLGSHLITLLVRDRHGKADTAQSVVTVVDQTAPVLDVSLAPAVLWPPDHRLVPVQASVTGTDACGPTEVILESILSSEPDDALGSPGSSDIQNAELGTPDFGFQLRAERSTSKRGRVYLVRYRGTDPSGNSSTSEAFVYVPFSQGNPFGR
jgi:hypothetical protein